MTGRSSLVLSDNEHWIWKFDRWSEGGESNKEKVCRMEVWIKRRGAFEKVWREEGEEGGGG